MSQGAACYGLSADDKPTSASETGPDDGTVPDDPVGLSQRLLETTRTGGDPGPCLDALADASDDDLAVLRADRRAALAFWVNCYNAGTQLLLERRPDLYESRLRTLRFFRAPALTVAGAPLGLDDIEQGILRGRSKYGLGYLPRFLVSSFETRYRLPELDPRVHFALNCGAASCPAIRFYEPGRIDEQLELATRTYLDATVDYDPEAGTVRVPRVFLWYRGDFGGASGTRAFLQSCDALPDGVSPSVRYHSWDWTRVAAKFTE